MIKYIKSFDNINIAYSIKKNKSKTWFIFLHGAGANMHAWDKIVNLFHDNDLSTITIDLRGHGKSQRPQHNTAFKLNNFSKDIKKIINTEKIKNFILVGHCFGGMVAINFSSKFPKLAKSYILIDTTYKSPKILNKLFFKNPFIVYLLNLRLNKVKICKEYKSSTNYNNYIGTGDLNLDRIISDIKNTTLKSWFFVYQNIAKFNGEKELKKIKQPILIIQGEKDIIFNKKIGEKMHYLNKKSDLIVLKNTSHVVIMNNPKKLARIIYKYLISKKLIEIS